MRAPSTRSRADCGWPVRAASVRADPPALSARPCNRYLPAAGEDVMVKALWVATLIASSAAVWLAAATAPARAEDLACVSTTFRLLGKNDRVCVSAFDDPKVPGGACHIRQARTGGLSGTIGLAEDRCRFSIAWQPDLPRVVTSCRQLGPINLYPARLTAHDYVSSPRTSIFFKRTHIDLVLDKERNTLVYLAISDKLIEGSPQNAISTVPIVPWVAGR